MVIQQKSLKVATLHCCTTFKLYTPRHHGNYMVTTVTLVTMVTKYITMATPGHLTTGVLCILNLMFNTILKHCATLQLQMLSSNLSPLNLRKEIG